MCNDKHSITCQNLEYISKECGFDNPLENPGAMNNVKYKEIPGEEAWRVNFLKELVQLRDGAFVLDQDQFSVEDISDLINFVATS